MNEAKQRVWAVWDGDRYYEAIDALFSSKERAEAFVEKCARRERRYEDGVIIKRRISVMTLDEE